MDIRPSSVPGVRVESGIDALGNAVFVTTPVQSQSRSLANYFSTVGDHRKPNNFRYSSTQVFNGTGVSRFQVSSPSGIRPILQLSGDDFPVAGTDHTLVDAGDEFARTRNIAINKLFTRVKGRDAVDTGSSFGEAVGRARSEIASSSRRLVNSANEIDKLRPRDFKALFPGKGVLPLSQVPIGALKVGSNLWLAWQYAIRPAINDAWAAVGHSIATDEFVKYVSAKHRGSGTKSVVRQVRPNYSPGYVLSATDVTSVNSIDFTHESKFKMAYVITDMLLFNLHSMTTFNPALIAWNMMPLSFVVDWFQNVSGYLEALENSMLIGAQPLWTVETSFRCEKFKSLATGNGSYDDGLGTTKSFSTFGENRTKVVTVRRTFYDRSSPIPTTDTFFNAPKLGSSRLLSAASLLSQVLTVKRVSPR